MNKKATQWNKDLLEYKPFWPDNTGTPLPMLSIQEIVDYRQLLNRVFSHGWLYNTPSERGKRLYRDHLTKDSASAKLAKVCDSLRRIWSIEDGRSHETREAVLVNELVAINEDINRTMSIHGWRKVRLEMSQIKKRNKTKRIMLDISTVERLEKLKESDESFKSYSAVIDFLYTEYKDSIRDNEEEHNS